MAQDFKDLSEAEEIKLDVNDMFSIQSTESIEADDLDNFLNDTVEKPKAKTVTPEKKEDPKPDPAKKSEPSEEEKKKAKAKEEVENSFDKLLEEEDPELARKNKTAKSDDEPGDVDETIQSIAEELYRLNIFTKTAEDEEAPSTPEEFLEKFTEEKQRGAEAIVEELAGRHGEEYRDAFYSIFVDGVHPKEYLTKFQEVQSFKDMDMTDEDNQIKVVESALRKQGWDEADIKDKVKSLKLNAELETDSLRYHKALVKYEEKELTATAERSKQEQARIEQLDRIYLTNLNNTLSKAIKDKELAGIPANKEVATKAFDLAYNKKWELKSSKEQITDLDRIFLELKRPENHALKAQLALLFAQTFEGFEEGKKLTLDLSNIQKKAVSTETNKLFENVKRSTKSSVFSPKKESTLNF